MNEFTPLLYYSPGACSMAAHVALLESGLPHRIDRRLIDAGETRTPEFLAINPLGRVPVLEIQPGRYLTEVPAILAWIDARRELLPRDPQLRVRAVEWMSLLGSTAHAAFGRVNRPERFTAVAAAQEELREGARTTYAEVLATADAWMIAPYVFGDTFTLVDAYLFVFWAWARHRQFDLSQLQRLKSFGPRMLARPAVRTAIEREGLLPLFTRAA